MINVSKTAELAAAPERVWDAMSDLAGWEKWLTIHQKWKSDLPSELGVGSKVTSVASVLNMPNTIEWTVDDWQPPRTMAISGEGMAGAVVTIELTVEPHATGSRLTVASSFEGQMIVGAIAGAIERAIKAELDTSLDNLAELVA